MEFSEGLEKIGVAAFKGSSIECVNFPSSTRRIGAEAFAECKQLCRVRLNEGLEALEKKGCYGNYEYNGRVFSGSALESVVIPSTLEVLEKRAFY